MQQITTAVLLPNKRSPPQPDNSAGVLFLLNPADNDVYGPPKPPPGPWALEYLAKTSTAL